ncbi:MAG: helix-turn-helix transcriptional regulator [Actinomycetaceae bacterium]
MQADRLIALVLLLQARGRVTATAAAAELAVATSTARRDLEALAAAGVPVYAQPGRGGGWQLVGGARTNLSGLTGHESRALFWLIGTAGLAGEETRRAMHKLVRALPATLRDEADRLATSVHHDHATWGDRPGEPPERLEALRDAVVARHVVAVTYRHRSGRRAAYRLSPLGLVAKAGVWYLVADDGRSPRSYRVDRVSDASDTGEAFEPPDGFDLVGWWRAHAEEVERMRSGVVATLRVPSRVVPIILEQLGRYARVVEADGEGVGAVGASAPGAILEVRAHLLVGLAEQLAGWGDRIEVVDPPELRFELARIGADLVAAHGAG